MVLSKKRARHVIEEIIALFPDAKPSLDFRNHFELLVAVIMSAQCTDERVNKITARIFPKYNTPEKMGVLSQEQLEEEIRDCGLFRSKAKNLLATCKMLTEEYNSVIPDTVEELMKLPGVGKKTANVVASIVYKVPAIAVDTHVFRVSHRLGLAKGDDPLAVEKELQKAIPKNKWSDAHHWLIWHGRKICKARKPLCSECVLVELCPYKEKNL